MGDYVVGLVTHPAIELATAVAASSASPPVLSPRVLKLDPNSFDTDFPAAITTPDFREQVVLADGSVFDNLAIESVWNVNRTILVSDGLGGLELEADPKSDWIAQTNRVLRVISNQNVRTRKRSIVELFKLGVRAGSYWGIGSGIQNYGLSDALVCPIDVTKKLANTPNRLTAIDYRLQEQLVDWGYAICDAGMRRWVLPDAPAPAQSPYGTFKKP